MMTEEKPDLFCWNEKSWWISTAERPIAIVNALYASIQRKEVFHPLLNVPQLNDSKKGIRNGPPPPNKSTPLGRSFGGRHVLATHML